MTTKADLIKRIEALEARIKAMEDDQGEEGAAYTMGADVLGWVSVGTSHPKDLIEKLPP